VSHCPSRTGNVTWIDVPVVSHCHRLCVCVSEERGEGTGSEALSDTLRYINLAGLAIGLVKLRAPMHRERLREGTGEVKRKKTAKLKKK
jgi:hypothetical protein